MTSSAAERYVRLGLQLGRHVEGIVDAYFGPPELAAAVDAERRLIRGSSPPPRRCCLKSSRTAGCATRWSASAPTPAGWWASPARTPTRSKGASACGRPTPTKPSTRAAHERLAELLPGDEPLAQRYQRWHDSILVPTERVACTVAAVIAEARAWTRGLVELPDAEEVVLEVVRDKAWLAFCEYLGGLRSRIAVNLDLPMSALELLGLTMHETYPGHHTERSSKDHLLVRGRGLLEEAIVLVPTPQSLVSEGIAELAPELLLQRGGAEARAAVMQDAGIELDLPHALAVERALEPCRWAEVNAALMLHEAGASEAEAQAYLERWGLMSPELTAHLIRFLSEPTSRTYAINYSAGRELGRSYVAGEPERFRRLLTEQVRVHDLLEANDAPAPMSADRGPRGDRAGPFR